MKMAVMGDVHSNIFALNSVLKDIENQKVDLIISTGDLVGYMPFPNEVINTLRSHKILAIQGNHDKAIAQSQPVQDEMIESFPNEAIQKSASAIFTNWTLTDENRSYLANLPETVQIHCNGFKLSVVHGSPRAVGEYLYEDKEKLDLLAEEMEADILVCGHTHVPYHYTTKGKHFINAGSVGKPKHGDCQAAYVIIEVKASQVKSQIIKVPYEVERMVKAILENPMIDDGLIPMLQQGF
jgi:putative phosphoesterase